MVGGIDPACILATWPPLPGLIFYVRDTAQEYRLESDAQGAAFLAAPSGVYGLRVPGMDVYHQVETVPTESFSLYPSPEGNGRVLGLYALSGNPCPE